MNGKIRSFTDLEAWQAGHKLAITIYKACERFDKYDSLRNQLERCAVSVTSNIAEGFGRQSVKDKTHFYIMARGSAFELQNQLLLARDVKKIDKQDFDKLASLSLDSIKLLHGLIRSVGNS